jgi:molybdate transport system ATP-binding protein
MLRVSLRKRLQAAHGEMELAVDMELATGELAALSGPSGAGKSCLLRMLAGLMRPDAGRIEADGEAWFDSAAGIDLPPRRRRPGLVFQDYALFPNMTVRGNLEYAARGHAARVRELLETAGLEGLAERRPDSLSGGQKQRVALARALAAEPRILLLDEPLAAMDAALRARLQDAIASLHGRYGLTTLLVTHDPGEIVRLAEVVFILEGGRITRTGAPAQVFAPASGADAGALRLRGTVLAIEDAGPARWVSMNVGGEAVRIRVALSDAQGLAPGDAVAVDADVRNARLTRE